MNRLHQSPHICISPPPRLHLNSTQAPIFTSHLHTSTHIKVSASSRSCLSSIQVIIFASHFHPGDVSPPSMSGKLSSTTPRSRMWCLTSIQVACHLHTGHENCTPALQPSPIPAFPCIKICSLTQSRSHRTPIHFLGLTSHLNLGS